MKKPIDFADLFNRVSDNREFAFRMLNTFFESWRDRLDTLKKLLEEREFDELADSAHQLKGILGNLALTRGHSLSKSIHEAARQKDANKISKLLDSLKKEIVAAQDYLKEHTGLFN